MNNFFKIGLQVLAAVAAGGAVFMGLSKAFKEDECGQRNQANPGNPADQQNNYQEPQQCIEQSNVNKPQPSTGETVVDCLRKTQDTCSKAMTILQNLTIAADSIVRVFSGGPSILPQQCGYGYGYGNYQQEPTPPGFRRISPHILEYIGDSPQNNYYGNKCY